jgi:apolipoprotein D and lipocalin family protein
MVPSPSFRAEPTPSLYPPYMRTHLILSLIPCVLALSISSCSNPSRPPLKTEAKVDISRYTGQWYEQFRLPNSFQKEGATAEARYTLQADGTVQVVNTETRRDNQRKSVTGTATVVPDGRNSRLQVRFQGLASLVPVPEEGNYWIIKLAPDYSMALVGTPDRKFLWLLSRKPKISAEVRTAYEKEAQRQGFDTSKLVYR